MAGHADDNAGQNHDTGPDDLADGQSHTVGKTDFLVSLLLITHYFLHSVPWRGFPHGTYIQGKPLSVSSLSFSFFV